MSFELHRNLRIGRYPRNEDLFELACNTVIILDSQLNHVLLHRRDYPLCSVASLSLPPYAFARPYVKTDASNVRDSTSDIFETEEAGCKRWIWGLWGINITDDADNMCALHDARVLPSCLQQRRRHQSGASVVFTRVLLFVSTTQASLERFELFKSQEMKTPRENLRQFAHDQLFDLYRPLAAQTRRP